MDAMRRNLNDATNALCSELYYLKTREQILPDMTYKDRIERARDACLVLQKELVGIDFYLCALASRESPSSSDKRRRPDLDDQGRALPKRAAPAPKMPDVLRSPK